jgi:hypothetical protein
MTVQLETSVCKRHLNNVVDVAENSFVQGPDLPQRTVALVRGLDLVLEHHECPIHIRAALDLQVHAYLDSSIDESMWLKKCKFLLTYPLAKYLRNELPPSPDSGPFRPTGDLHKWMQCRLMAFCRRNTHLWYSWFQSKRATLPLSDVTVEETYKKHLTTLTKEDKGDDTVIRQIFEDRTFSRLLNRIKEQIMTNLSRGCPFEQLSASSSASFEATRGMGGQHSVIRSRVGLDSEQLWGTQLERMEWRAYAHGRVRESNVLVEVRSHDGLLNWQRVRRLAGSYDISQPLSCTIQAVLEPNKVRVISKGEAIPYYSMRPLQKAMHSAMRDIDCFRLIGRPFSATDIIDLRDLSKPTWKWFSIDYSAATDGLSWKYSGAIFERLIYELPKDHYDIAMRVLGPHKLFYPTRNGQVEFRGVQTNGQLMGSVLSFPILCLANIGVYLLATQDIQQGWTDAQRLRHVLVNGDDMVYAGPEELWEKHVDLGKRVGLEMSIGKAYIHDTYLNVNSVSVHAPLAQPKVHPWRIDYLNVGLAFGQHKVQNRESLLGTASCDDRKPEGYVCNINTVLDGCLPGRQTKMLKWILMNKRDEIQSETTVISDTNQRYATKNLFLPIQIGGMGVLPPSDWRFRISKDQVVRALCALGAHSAKASLMRPIPGYELNIIDSDINEPYIKQRAEKDDQISKRKEERSRRDMSSALESDSLLRSDRRLIRSIATIIRYDTAPTVWTR